MSSGRNDPRTTGHLLHATNFVGIVGDAEAPIVKRRGGSGGDDLGDLTPPQDALMLTENTVEREFLAGRLPGLRP